MTEWHFIAKILGLDFSGNEFDWTPGLWVTDVEGLSSGGAVTYNRASRGFGPGVHDVDNRREDPRIIAITGFAYAKNASDLGTYVDQLGGLLADDQASATLEWTEFGQGWRRVSVRRFGTPDIDRTGSTGFVKFRVSFRASDQRVYGPPSATERGTEVAGENKGAYPAPLVLEVQGDSPNGWTAWGPRGTVVIVSAPLAPGATHRYDGDTGLLEINGVAQTVGVTRSDPIEAPPGPFTVSINNGCTVQVLYASTWAP